MKTSQVKENMNNPEELERLYHEDKRAFGEGFADISPDNSNESLYRYWKIRLDFDRQGPASRVTLPEIVALIIACSVVGILIKIPDIFNIDLKQYSFFEKNAGLIVFLGLSLFITWTNRTSDWKKLLISSLVFIIPAIYINLLPPVTASHSVILAYIHLPLLLWCVYGLVYIDFDTKDLSKRTDYIKHNGDLVILTGLILIAGMMLAGITIALFSVIDINIEKFYMRTVAYVGAVAAPIVATFIIRNYPFVTNKLAPIIATIFSPLVLITLVIYLFSVVITGKDPFNDREFLIVFNLMLIGVMGVVVFSVSEMSTSKRQRVNEIVIFILAGVTILINLVALSAIFYRLGEYGISSNRVAVLGSNLLIFINLILITIDLYKVNFKNAEINCVEKTISKYLPVYLIWTFIVVFSFPLIFSAE